MKYHFISTLAFIVLTHWLDVAFSQQSSCIQSPVPTPFITSPFKKRWSSTRRLEDFYSMKKFVIPGVFSISEPGTEGPFGKCGNVSVRGFEAAMSFLHTIDKLNFHDPEFETHSGGITLTGLIIDACGSAQRGLNELVNLLTGITTPQGQIGADINMNSLKEVRTVYIGIEGREANDLVKFVGEMGLIPFSATANSSLLSNAKEFPNFLRTRSSTSNTAESIVSILWEYRFKYVSLVFDQQDEDMARDLVREAVLHGVCVGLEVPVDQSAAGVAVGVAALLHREFNAGAKVIVLLTNKEITREIVAEVAKRNFQPYWIGGQDWGDSDWVATGKAAFGAITLKPVDERPYVGIVHPQILTSTASPSNAIPEKEFHDYFIELIQGTPASNNPDHYPARYIDSYLRAIGCADQFGNNFRCDDVLNLNWRPKGNVEGTSHAVLAMAWGITNYVRQNCNRTSVDLNNAFTPQINPPSNQLDSYNPAFYGICVWSAFGQNNNVHFSDAKTWAHTLFEAIRDTRVEESDRRSYQYLFPGDSLDAPLEVYNYQLDGYERVGSFTRNNLQLERDRVRFYMPEYEDWYEEGPLSECDNFWTLTSFLTLSEERDLDGCLGYCNTQRANIVCETGRVVSGGSKLTYSLVLYAVLIFALV